VLVMDPPFGGRVEPLAKTVHEIMWLHKKLCPNSQRDMIGMCIFSVELLKNKFSLNSQWISITQDKMLDL